MAKKTCCQLRGLVLGNGMVNNNNNDNDNDNDKNKNKNNEQI